MGEVVKAAAVPDKHTKKYVESKVLTKGASGADFANVGTMEKAVADSSVFNQHNKECVEAESLPEKQR